MTLSKLRIISRKSPLALWQAGYVRDKLCQINSGLEVEIIGIKTKADKFLDVSLGSLGGKGLFVKELEQALLDDKADIAVHSMKDVTVDLPERLSLQVIMTREDVRDVFVSKQYDKFENLPVGARVGTSSLRRQCQLKVIRPDLNFCEIRGNIGTRLKKLDDDQFDALILAAAGMKRLDMEARINEYFEFDVLLPAMGQGALGIESRTNDRAVNELISTLNDKTTFACVTAERSLSRKLYGGCHVPIAGYAEVKASQIEIHGLVGKPDGSEIVRSSVTGSIEQGIELGNTLGQEILDKGAEKILQDLLNGST